MDYILSFLNNLTPDPDYQRWIVLGVIAIVVFALLMIVSLMVGNYTDKSEKRIRNYVKQTKKTTVNDNARFSQFAKKIMPLMAPSNEEEVSRVRTSLIQAGYRGGNELPVYYFTKLFLTLIFPGLFLLSTKYIPDLETNEIIMITASMMVLGVFIPNWVLHYRKESRQLKIKRGFANSLDLLVVCMEAGLGFDIALRRVGNELKVSHPVLAEEFNVINAEINAGVERSKALRNFAYRTGLDEIKGFVALLNQCIKLGTSLGSALRMYADEFRDRRMQYAEEQAAKVGTKLIFPLVLCFFPCFFIFSLGPPIIRALEMMK